MSNTCVNATKLYEAIDKALATETRSAPPGVDYYCLVVAEAAGLPVEEVQTLLQQRDKGIMSARSTVKCHLFFHTYGVTFERLRKEYHP